MRQDFSFGLKTRAPVSAWPSQTVKKQDNAYGMSNATHTAGADILVFVPFTILRKTVVDQLSMRVTVVGAGAEYLLGVYDSDPITGLPKNRLATSAALNGAVGTGDKVAPVNLALRPGLYWGAIGIKSTATPATVSRMTSSNGFSVLGPDLSDLGGTAIYRYYQANAFVYATGLPAVAPAVTPSIGSDGIIIGFRKA